MAWVTTKAPHGSVGRSRAGASNVQKCAASRAAGHWVSWSIRSVISPARAMTYRSEVIQAGCQPGLAGQVQFQTQEKEAVQTTMNSILFLHRSRPFDLCRFLSNGILS